MIAPSITDQRSQIEDYLKRIEFSREPATAGLHEAMRDRLLASGERVRPLLALATAAALGRRPTSVLPLAAALELIHTGALMHDALPAMAGGRPPPPGAPRDDVALLAGDALLAEALVLVLHEQEGEPERVLAATAELARAAGVDGLIGAQYVHVTAGPASAERAPDRLLAAAVETVLELAGESEPARAPLRRFAAHLALRPGGGDELRAALAQVPADTSALQLVVDRIDDRG